MPTLSTIGAACARAWGFTSGLVKDQYFNLVSLLLPGNGTNGAQNNTFLDGSSNTFTITRNGNTTQGTFSPFSQTGWGNYFDGSSYLANTSTTSVVAPGTSNFTAEFWVYATTDQQSQTYGTVLHVGSGTSGCFLICLLYSSAGAMKIRFSTSTTDYDSTSTISTNRWYHIAIVREGTGSNQTKMYVDGSLFHTFTLSDNLSNSSGLYIGATAFGLTVRRLSGYVSNIRLTNGTALYTGAFTPSTTPLTTTSQGATATQVELLACQSNRFLDNSSNGWVFTTSGSPSVVAFSPFAPTQSYSAATVGGSGYFDGTGDWLSAPANTAFDLGTGDFTIEGWFYYAENPPASYDYLWAIGGNNTNGIALYVDNKVPKIWNGSNVLTTTGSVPGFAWTHIAAVRSSGTLVVYQNGTSIGSVSFTSNLTGGATAGPKLGRWDGVDVQDYFGYVNGFRIIKGTAVYTGNFTPPSLAPLTTAGSTSAASYPSTTNVNTSFASSATSLLLNFTNAGVVDATAKNVLETVGNAQISTTQSKWGGGSMYFDGNGDNLVGPASTDLDMGTGNWTIEGWVNITTRTLNYPSIISNNNGSFSAGALSLQVSNADSVSYNDRFVLGVYDLGGTRNLVSSVTNSTGVWYYFAVVRNGTNLSIYRDGTSVASTTISSALTFNWGKLGLRVGGGNWDGAQSYLNGYLDDLRITKGVARTITASPTAPFPVQ